MMAKNSHPGKREALEEFKRLYMAQLQMEIDSQEYWDFREKILADPDLGINGKTLDRAVTEALLERKKQLSHS